MSASERKIAELEFEVAKLRNLLGKQMRTGEELEVSAIVNSDGVPKVDLRWDQLGAQMVPDEARDFALSVIRVAGWAEQDATMFVKMREVFDEQTAAGFLAMMRESRGEADDTSASTGG